MRDSHPCILEIMFVVSEHMAGESHASDPGLAAAARGAVLVNLEWCVKQAAKVQGCVRGRFVLGQRCQVQIEGERIEFLL